MSGHEVTMAQAEIRALTEQVRQRDHKITQLTRERDEARALLARLKTSMAERVNDPMQDGWAP